MNDQPDYLWDRSGAVDDGVAALERALAPLAWPPRELPLDSLPPQAPAPRAVRRWPWLALTAALLAVAIAFAVWRGSGAAASPDLAPEAAPRMFVTGKESRVVTAGRAATLTLGQGTELRFDGWHADELHFTLVAGSVEAVVAAGAPPLRCATPAGEVVAAAGRLRLQWRTDAGRLAVTEGSAEAGTGLRRAFVPAGASVALRPRGFGTPLFDDATQELRDAVAEFDKARLAGVRGDSGGWVVKRCLVPRDTLVLWHLLTVDDEALRSIVEYRLFELVGAPAEIVAKDLHWDREVWRAFLRAKVWR